MIEREDAPEPLFAAMAFVQQYQTTADSYFIEEATNLIRRLWGDVELQRAKLLGQRPRSPPRPFKIVGD